MDAAVALTQAYLEAHGYFTVTEYNVLELLENGGSREATDLDVLAVRFPGERTVGPSNHTGSMAVVSDPQLAVDVNVMDMIVGEVKRGRARFNAATRSAGVLEAALVRFGCCAPEDATSNVETLLRDGVVYAGPHKHRIRLIAFGSTGADMGRAYQVIKHERMLAFLEFHLQRHWSRLGRVQMLHSTLAMLTLQIKARHDSRPRAAEPNEVQGDSS